MALEHEPPDASSGKAPRILVVDDHPKDLLAIQAMLAPLGFDLVCTTSGEAALREVLQQEFSLFLLDITMPGMDGFELATLIRGRDKYHFTPILFLTASSNPEDIARGYQVGASDYLQKPLDRETLQSKVCAYLRFSARSESVTAPPPPLARILLVDDDPHNLLALQGALFNQGVELVTASSGEEALTLLGQQEFALVFLDIRLPGLDGYEVTRLIRRSPRFAELPIILITAVAKAPEFVLKGYEAGAADFLFSPAEPGILRAKARVFLDFFLNRKFRELHAQFQRDLERGQAERQLLEEQLRTQKETEARHLEAQQASADRALAQERAASITELERLNERLKVSNKDLESFSYSISHDLRAPLRHLDGFLEMLEEDLAGALDPKALNHLERVKAASRSMSRLIEGLLELSRSSLHDLEMIPLDLAPLVRSVAEGLMTEAGARQVEWRIGPLPSVTGDPVLLRALLENLLGNAFKFTSREPWAVIEVGTVEGLPGERGFFIRDNGAGFDPSQAQRLFGVFQRFHRAEEFEGTGIGLANAHRIMQRHGGRIWAESAPGQGATFRVAFPWKDRP